MAVADPTLFTIVLSLFAILLVGLIFHKIKQPGIVGYIIVGVLIGPNVLHLISSVDVATTLGNLGIILLLFFIGMEISVPDLLKGWRVAIFGTLGQILLSIGIIYILGSFFAWPFSRVVLFGFVISLSSTAVLLKLLEARGELHSERGRNVLAVLLAQDLAIVPMIIIVSLMGGTKVANPALQVIGALFFAAILYFVFKHKDQFTLPFSRTLEKDHDLQMFMAMIACFGFAALSSVFGLSEALGAFLGGIAINKIKGTNWIHGSLHSFKILFVAVFFVSIGLLIDINFIIENIGTVIALVGIVFLVNTLINATTFKFLGTSWKESFYYGATLSQIGEFSFLLAAIGLSTGLIMDYSYQLILSVIAITLLLSPMWIYFFEKVTHHVRNVIK